MKEVTIKDKHGIACLWAVPSGWYIVGIVVDKEYQHKGIGTRLMNRIINEYGDRKLYLYACDKLGTDVQFLQKFYGKFGFKPISDTKSIDHQYITNMVRECYDKEGR
jgi:GNAT superfamily N-acetyltransferase